MEDIENEESSEDVNIASDKLLLVINPRSGVKKPKTLFDDVVKMIDKNGWKTDLVFTEYREHATQIISQATDYRRIVCMGGDGTLNEAINGMLKNPSVNELGYIPAGSTNDFAAGLGLPRSILRSAKFSATAEALPTDIGSFKADGDTVGRHFSYVASFGVFTKVSYATDQKFKNTFGKLAYIFEGIRTVSDLHKFKPFRMRIEFEDGTAVEQDYIFGAVTNSTSLGGIMKLDKKHVHVDDGQFELLLIRTPKNLASLTETVTELLNHKYRSENIIFSHVKKIKMISELPLSWTLDGEYAGEVSCAEISVNTDSLKLVRPDGVRKKPFFKKSQI